MMYSTNLMYGYFQLQALLGITKHLGGFVFTRRLVERCQVDGTARLLYVGIGNGKAAEKIVHMTGCELVGFDLLPEMVRSAKRYATGRVELLAADAEQLPFADRSFDVVISESVTAFTQWQRSLPEYHRVLEPGGFLGLNEVTWLETPSDDILAYVAALDDIHPQTKEGWVEALAQAGFGNIDCETGPLRVMEQLAGETSMIDLQYLGIARRFFSLLFTDPVFRQSMWQLARSTVKVPRGLTRCFGYGLYVARK